MKTALKFIIGLFFGLSLAALVAFGCVLAWAATGPRTLTWITPYIQDAFRSAESHYSLHIEETVLLWDGWRHPLDLRLRGVKVLGQDERVFSAFPEISLGLDIASLIGGRVMPTSLTIKHPVISLYQSEDGAITFGVNPGESGGGAPFSAVVERMIGQDGENPLGKLHMVSIQDADLSVGNAKLGVFFQASDVQLALKRAHGVVRATARASISEGHNLSGLTADFTLSRRAKRIEGKISFLNLMPAPLAHLFNDNPVLTALQFPLSGEVRMALSMEGTFESAAFSLEGAEGAVACAEFENAIPVKRLQAGGSIGQGGRVLRIDRLQADLGGPALSARGSVALNAQEQTSIRLSGTLTDVPTSDIRIFWPVRQSPLSREWITANISSGMIRKAALELNVKAGDLEKPLLPAEAVAASVEFHGARVRYLPDHPPATGMDGVVHLTGKAMTAELGAGDYMEGTKLASGVLAIGDLNADNPYITLDLQAAGPASDVVRFLSLPDMGHAQRLNISADRTSGNVEGRIRLGFHFFAPRDSDGKSAAPDVEYDIQAKTVAVSQLGFLGKFDIEDANGTIAVDRKRVEYKGSARVNGVNAQTTVAYLMKPDDKGFDTFIDVSGVAPVETLPRFGYPAFAFLKGALGVKASVRLGKDVEFSEADLDLAQAQIDLADLRWKKPAGKPAVLALKAEKREGAVSIPSFALKAEDVDAKGSAALDAALSGFKHIRLSGLVYGSTRLESGLYEVIAGGMRFEATGAELDLRPWEKQGVKDFSFERFPALELKLDVSRVMLGQKRELSAVKGEVTCNAMRCESANLTGMAGEGKTFALRIERQSAQRRKLEVQAEDAGAFLRAIGVIKGMSGGALLLAGQFDDAKDSSLLRGKIEISEHTMNEAPILARILTLTALTSIFDTLQGHGVRFVKLSAPFSMKNDVITLENAKTYGPALGMTAEGTIVFPGGHFDVRGTVVPSYTLNTVLDKVPLLGDVLTGGEGQGVFAARYTLKGTEEDPKIAVNPLSILTPGFLRGLFDVFDDKRP